MSSRKQRIDAEAAALWRELYDEAPPRADGGEMLDLMLNRLPAVSYERINSPFMRLSAMSWPRAGRR
jgi:hypothetical protein